MKIDLHTHCLPVSRCATIEPEDLPRIAKECGLDAIVLTNHCHPYHCDPLAQNLCDQAKEFLKVFHRCKQSGEKLGLKVFFGVEVKIVSAPTPTEFLLFGITEDQFLESYPLYSLNQKELFDYCNKNNILMIQSHPYRSEQGYCPADINLLHGIEILNSHSFFELKFEESKALVEQNGLLFTAGSDTHRPEDSGSGGMIVPDDIQNEFELRDFLKNGKPSVFKYNNIIYPTK